jgi:hypothetical protein
MFNVKMTCVCYEPHPRGRVFLVRKQSKIVDQPERMC